MEVQSGSETIGPRSIEYVNSNGEIKHEKVVDANDAKRILRDVIENDEKQVPGTSYQIRDFLLRNSDGKVDSQQAFARNLDFLDIYNPYSEETLNYFNNPNNWVSERSLLHKRTIKNKLEKGIELSKQIDDAEPTIYIVRGNIASGKSTALREHPHFERMRQGLDGVISPDDYKILIKDVKIGDNKPLIDSQVHHESLMLSEKIQEAIVNYADKKLSLVIDKRFAWNDEIEKILALAQDQSRKVDIFDVDTPLELSIIRVLSRDFPRPDFETLNDGFERIRKYRRGLIEEAKRNRNISYYILVDTGVGGPASYLDVVVIEKQIQDIKDEVMFNKLAPDLPKSKIENEIEKDKKKHLTILDSYIIDKYYLEKVQRKYLLNVKEISGLKRYVGMSPVEAVDRRSLEV